MTQISKRQRDDEVVISIDGPFTFEHNKAFREAYQAFPPGTRFHVDLSGVQQIDSASLGMLLRLREHAGADAGKVALSGAVDHVLGVLKIANFEKLFTLR